MARAINHLLESPDAINGYFIVGEEQERIGIVKQLVAECSSVFQAMLYDSKMKEKGDVEMPDVHPDALKIYLKFAYGALEVPSLWEEFTDWSPETAVQVVAFAEKCDVPQLQEIALAQIKPSQVTNLFPALHCVAKYGAASIADDVQKIVQQNTKSVLESLDFLELDQDSVLYILGQDVLSVPEVELFKAALAWANHRVEAENLDKLKHLMGKLLSHIRLLTIPSEDIYDYVEPSKLFSSDEIVELCKPITRKRNDITICSNNMNKRTGSGSSVSVDLHALHVTMPNSETRHSGFKVKLTAKAMMVKSILCYGPRESTGYPPVTSVTLTVYKQNEKQHAVTYNGQVISLHQRDTIISPEALGWRPIELAPHCEYRLELEFGHGLSSYSWNGQNSSCQGHTISNHGSIYCDRSRDSTMINSHIKRIQFVEIV